MALNLEAASQDAKSAESRVPSDELVPLQFRMTPAFVKKFKQAALDHDMKLNEFLTHICAPSKSTKRLTLDLTDDLHRRIKVACSVRGTTMVVAITKLLEKEFREP